MIRTETLMADDGAFKATIQITMNNGMGGFKEDLTSRFNDTVDDIFALLMQRYHSIDIKIKKSK